MKTAVSREQTIHLEKQNLFLALIQQATTVQEQPLEPLTSPTWFCIAVQGYSLLWCCPVGDFSKVQTAGGRTTLPNTPLTPHTTAPPTPRSLLFRLLFKRQAKQVVKMMSSTCWVCAPSDSVSEKERKPKGKGELYSYVCGTSCCFHKRAWRYWTFILENFYADTEDGCERQSTMIEMLL